MAKRLSPEEWRARLSQLDEELRRKKGPSWNEECNLCRRTFSFRFLQRCFWCGRLYCEDCLTEGFTKDDGVICLNCARRHVSPRKKASKYDPLSNYLAYRARYTTVVTLTFAKIEEIIADALPSSALRKRNWWNNSEEKAWVDVGWDVLDVDFSGRTVTFRRPKGLVEKKQRKRKKAPEFVLPPKPKKRRRPSKTKIARAYAQLKNLERRRSSMKRHRGRFKPKSAFEKRLWRSDEKPSVND